MVRIFQAVVILLLTTAIPMVAQLPPEILVDRYLLQAEQRQAQGNHYGALESLQKALDLQKEHELTLPDEFHFQHAQVAFAAGSFPAALDSVNQYLVAAGREGEFYQKALELLLAIKAAADRTPCAGQPKGAECWLELANQAGCYLWNSDFQPYKTVTWTGECAGGVAQGTGTLKWVWDIDQGPPPAEKTEISSNSSSTTPIAPEPRAGLPSLFRGEPTCTGQPKGAECWLELANQPGCYLWNPNLQVDETVTWTGECAEGMAQGTGTIKWVGDDGKRTREDTGHLEDGKYHGQWVRLWPDGDVLEGPYVEGKKHGHWVRRSSDGNVAEDLYVDGEKVESTGKAEVMEGLLVNGKARGQWIIRHNTENIEEGPYVEGKKHGHWASFRRDGSVNEEGPYVEGKKHGHWVKRYADGSVNEKMSYVEGKEHGHWASFRRDGSVNEEGPYVEGKKHGDWTSFRRDGNHFRLRRSYVEGKLHGYWIRFYEDRDNEKGSYFEGKRQGHWVRRLTGGGRAEGSYVEGKAHGDWTIWGKNGNVQEGPFVNGRQHGEWIFYLRGKKREHTKITYTDGRAEFLRPEMVEIPGGSFRMGCVSGKSCQGDEKPVHEVRIASFALSKYEVTFEEYDQFTAATGRERAADEGWGRGRRPVIFVLWKDAVAYTEWLSEAMGERYRLPSEAEWEYAARAGSVTKYSWGNKIGRNRANCEGCGSQWDNRQTAPVGSFGPNGWGLHDMHGNVREWVQDCWNKSYRGAPVDGSAWESGGCSQRVLRGGSWLYGPRNLRSANRIRFTTSFRNSLIGFRVARTVTP